MDVGYSRDLSEKLDACRKRSAERQIAVAPLLDRNAVTLAGFGNKGRPLAYYLRDVVGKTVHIYDASEAGRASALKAGFDVVDSKQQVDSAGGVILGACQHQLQQADEFPGNFVFFEEAGYFFDVPLLFNRSQEFSQWIVDNQKEVVAFTAALEPRAREALESVLRFKMSQNPNELAQARRPVSGMWFDIPKDFRKRPYACFLDVGAFDGDTLEAIGQWDLGFSKAVAIEANTAFEKQIMAKERLFSEGLQIVPCAAWDKSCRLDATEDLSGMVRVTESETGSIKAEPLDDVVSAKVDFMKLDIEGAEASALAGAQRILANGPDLAIAAYHRPEDIIALYQVVSDYLGSNKFDFHVGHYSECLDDTIYYFLVDQS